MDYFIAFVSIIGLLDLLPQTWRVHRAGHAHGLSRLGLVLIGMDKVLNLVLMGFLGLWPLFGKYLFGVACVAYLAYYRFYVTPHKED